MILVRNEISNVNETSILYSNISGHFYLPVPNMAVM